MSSSGYGMSMLSVAPLSVVPQPEEKKSCCPLWLIIFVITSVVILIGIAVYLYASGAPGLGYISEMKTDEKSGYKFTEVRPTSECPKSKHTEYCCIEHQFLAAVDATEDLKGFPKVQKPQAKKLLRKMFAELEDDAAKHGKPYKISLRLTKHDLWEQKWGRIIHPLKYGIKEAPTHVNRVCPHVHYKGSADNCPEFWKDQMQMPFPKDGKNSDVNEGKLTIGYLTRYNVYLYHKKDDGKEVRTGIHGGRDGSYWSGGDAPQTE